LIVDLEYISNYARIKISRGLLHAALIYLERAGYIGRVSEFEKKDSIHFTMEKNRLKQFVNTSNNEELKNIILQLLRQFGSALFSGSKSIQAGKIASSLSIPVPALYDKLTTLDNLGIISFQKAIDKDTIQLTAPRTVGDKLTLNYKMINESYINAQRKLNLMTDFAYTKKCRFIFILNYFGEQLDDYQCGKCDNCLAGERLTDSTAEYISEIIIRTLNEAEKPIDENALINILQGKKVKESFEKFKEFGTCINFDKDDIKIVVRELAAKRFITRTSGAKRILDITEKGKGKLIKTGAIMEEDAPAKDYEENLYLFNLLKDARKKASKKFLQTGNVICPDELLREIVGKKPATKAGLLAIPGFNNRMFNKIGNDFLEIINDFIKNDPVKTAGKEENTLPKNIYKTYELLLRKYSLQSISELRKLSEAVISMQIETILEYKPETDIGFLFEDEIFEMIKKQVETGYGNLKDLKEKLPTSVPYSLIRISAAKLKYTNPS
jgi:ATP-dependent DNA helicase RecQ